MPAPTETLPTPPPPVRWTREAMRRAATLGALDPERYELLTGELFEKMKHRRHTITLRRLRQALLAFFEEAYLQSEAPIDVAPDDTQTNAPEPDLVILLRPDETFLESNPGPSDIALVIEVADSTLRRDLSSKATLYARAGIPEYWVVDIENRSLHCHRNPQGEHWTTITVLDTTQTIAPLTQPTATLSIGELFPTAIE